jgi:maltose alpha-D-glucosyltransferase / alpha-amylase
MAMPKGKTVLDDKLHWYKDAIIYELHIKAFRDSNGDGIGDFEGLLEKLDYLEDLGITAIWVLPFYPSPLRDDGYDIADYFHINPAYGNINDFKRLLKEAHKRNLKVITELVINHTSDQNPWFQRARRAPKGSVERDYYVWTDDPGQYKDVRIIFQDFESSNWTWDAVAQQYYWHRFFHHQPDLNYDNPKVQEEIFKILDYWCKLGVDGFRLDAVPYLFEREGTNGENLPETHAFLKKLRKHIDDHFPGTVFLAEANMWPEDSASYFGNGDECHMNYHFPVMPRIFMALQMEGRYPITDIFEQTPEIPETCQWAIFLRNHDELTLEMVTDEERDYMYKVYVKDPKARINLGIRHRLAPLMENNRRKIELLNCLLFSLRGTPVIYYGDEIGMGDNFYLGDRDGVRTPMQWSPDRNAGFSETNPQKLYLPIILDPEYHYEAINVETQYRNTSSLLWFMKRLIGMRKKYKAFGRGDMKFINVENSKVLAFVRTYEEETILVVVNLSRYSQAAELDLSDYKGYVPVELFSKNRFPLIQESNLYLLTLDTYSCYWFQMEKAYPQVAEELSLPLITIEKWKDLIEEPTLEELENMVLPDYLMKATWFDDKEFANKKITVRHHASIPVPGNETHLLIVEVMFESELPSLYQVMVTMAKDEMAKKLVEAYPQAVLSRIKVNGEEGILCDALYTAPLQQFFVSRMAKGQDLAIKNGELKFSESVHLKKYLAGHTDVKSRVVSDRRSHTSITYDASFFLKIYRQVDYIINPDVEITRFLNKQHKFESYPRYIGVIEWELGKYTINLGMMQELVANHGDGRTYMQDRLSDYNEKLVTLDKEHIPAITLQHTLNNPIPYEEAPEKVKEAIGVTAGEAARLLGMRTGEMHRALAAKQDGKDFDPENFSLHYQRSLFAGMQSLVRSAYSNQGKNLKKLADDVRPAVEEIISRKDEVVSRLKKIYSKKFDVTKVRIHGNYYLEQVLFTGKDVSILHFGGDPSRSFSERRIKRSPLRDVAGIIRSFHYAAHENLLSNRTRTEDIEKLKPFAPLWTHYMTSFFMHAYLESVQGESFIPKNKNELEVLLEVYLLERAIFSLHYELNRRPDWVMVPVRVIKSIIDP